MPSHNHIDSKCFLEAWIFKRLHFSCQPTSILSSHQIFITFSWPPPETVVVSRFAALQWNRVTFGYSAVMPESHLRIFTGGAWDWGRLNHEFISTWPLACFWQLRRFDFLAGLLEAQGMRLPSIYYVIF